jgi:hypothetical protein
MVLRVSSEASPVDSYLPQRLSLFDDERKGLAHDLSPTSQRGKLHTFVGSLTLALGTPSGSALEPNRWCMWYAALRRTSLLAPANPNPVLVLERRAGDEMRRPASSYIEVFPLGPTTCRLDFQCGARSALRSSSTGSRGTFRRVQKWPGDKKRKRKTPG